MPLKTGKVLRGSASKCLVMENLPIMRERTRSKPPLDPHVGRSKVTWLDVFLV